MLVRSDEPNVPAYWALLEDDSEALEEPKPKPSFEPETESDRFVHSSFAQVPLRLNPSYPMVDPFWKLPPATLGSSPALFEAVETSSATDFSHLFSGAGFVDRRSSELSAPGGSRPRSRNFAASTSVLEEYTPVDNEGFPSASMWDDFPNYKRAKPTLPRRSYTDQFLPSYPLPNIEATAYLDLAKYKKPSLATPHLNGALFSTSTEKAASLRGKRGKDHTKRKNRVCSFCSVKRCANANLCKGRGGKKYCDCCANE